MVIRNAIKNREEVHVMEDDDEFEQHVHRILADLLPHTPKNKKLINENFSMDKFNKLSLSNNQSESASDSDTSSDREGEEWPHNILVTIVSSMIRNLVMVQVSFCLVDT